LKFLPFSPSGKDKQKSYQSFLYDFCVLSVKLNFYLTGQQLQVQTRFFAAGFFFESFLAFAFSSAIFRCYTGILALSFFNVKAVAPPNCGKPEFAF